MPTSTQASGTPMIVVMAGRLGPLADKVAAGTHPTAELLELTGPYGAGCFDHDVLDDAGRAVRAVARVAGRNWALALLSAIRHRRPAVLIATGEDIGLPLAFVHGLLRRRRTRCPIVVIAHGSYLNSSRAHIVGPLFRRRRDLTFLCLSSAIADQFVERFHLARRQVRATGWGVDTTFFTPPAHGPDPATFRVVAAGLANRDYRTLIDAMRDIDGELKIAADSAWFRSDVDLGGIDSAPSGAVEARSYGDYVALRALYASASVVVVPLHQARHACGYAVIAEAMAMGRPVVATSTIGRSDFISEGVTGWYVAPGDVDGLRDRLRAIAQDRAAAAGVGRAAAEAIRHSSSVPSYTGRIVEAALGRTTDAQASADGGAGPSSDLAGAADHLA